MTEPRLQAALRAAEDELAHLRGQLARAADFIHNPAHEHASRRALAEMLGIPEPKEQK